MDKIAVLIPCYNESHTISKVVTDFRSQLPEAVIYVYDNNSTDGADRIAQSAGAIIRYERRQGKGAVVRSMFRDIEAECYIMVDGDDTYPADAARKLAEPILRGEADMVIGDRLSATYYKENKRPFHGFGNTLVKQIINVLFQSRIDDIMTGYRAFSFEFVKSLPVLSRGFEIETEMSIHALDKGLRILSIPVEYRDRPSGSFSKLHTFRDGVRVLKTIASLFKNYKPFAFFGILALLLAVLSLVLIIPVLIEFFRTSLVLRFPTLIVGGFFMMAALLSYFSGCILDGNIKRQRQEFLVTMNLFRLIGNELRRQQEEHSP